MKNSQYEVSRTLSTTTRRLLESFSTVCGNFPEEEEEEGKERRRYEVTVEMDEFLKVRREKCDEDKRAKEMDDKTTAHFTHKTTQHPTSTRFCKGVKKREKQQAAPSRVNLEPQPRYKSPRHPSCAQKDEEFPHTRKLTRSREAFQNTTFHQQKSLSIPKFLPIAPNGAPAHSSPRSSYASCFLLLRCTLGLNRGSRTGFVERCSTGCPPPLPFSRTFGGIAGMRETSRSFEITSQSTKNSVVGATCLHGEAEDSRVRFLLMKKYFVVVMDCYRDQKPDMAISVKIEKGVLIEKLTKSQLNCSPIRLSSGNQTPSEHTQDHGQRQTVPAPPIYFPSAKAWGKKLS